MFSPSIWRSLHNNWCPISWWQRPPQYLQVATPAQKSVVWASSSPSPWQSGWAWAAGVHPYPPFVMKISFLNLRKSNFCLLELGIFTWIWSVWLKTGLLLFMISSVIFDQLLFLDAIVAWRMIRRAKDWTSIHQSPEPSRQGPGTRVLGQFWADS